MCIETRERKAGKSIVKFQKTGGFIDMKKRVQGFIIGFIIASILSGTVAFATIGTRSMQATYRDIRIVINDVPFTPRDVGGNIVEPFIVAGTTYLPLRAIGEAVDMNVTWDGNANTVFLDSLWTAD